MPNSTLDENVARLMEFRALNVSKPTYAQQQQQQMAPPAYPPVSMWHYPMFTMSQPMGAPAHQPHHQPSMPSPPPGFQLAYIPVTIPHCDPITPEDT